MTRFMAFNIWRSGKLDGAPGGEQNLAELIEFLRHEDPDVLFMVETYGSGAQIVDGLGPAYTGIPITQRALGEDNLWLFTRLAVDHVHKTDDDPVAATLPQPPGDRPVSQEPLTSFNFGGARLLLPDGRPIQVFATWLHWLGDAWGNLEETVRAIAAGSERPFSDEELLADDSRRLTQARILLQERLPGYLGDDDVPVILGGDLNALSHLDWAPAHASAPGHGGLSFEWPTLKAFEDAGFSDTYRVAHPDAGSEPGVTWTPLKDCLAPGRIDYILTRGQGIRVVMSYEKKQRLDQHRGTELDARFPFYSDHGAVVTDLEFD